MVGKISSSSFVEKDVIRILHIEDDETDARLVRQQLANSERLEVDLTRVESLSKGVEALTKESFHIVLLDLILPDSEQGISSFEQLHKAVHYLPPVLMLTGMEDRKLARKLLKLGAQDFVSKDELRGNTIVKAIENAMCRQYFASDLSERSRLLKDSENRVRSIVEVISDALIVVDGKGIIQFANPAAASLFGRDAQYLYGTQFGFPITTDKTFEIDVRRVDKSPGIAEMRTTSLIWDGKPCVLASLRDITDRVHAERKVRRLSRMQRVLSSINNLVVRVDGREQLFSSATRVAVEDGDFLVAWLGLIDHDAKEFKVVASYGADGRFVDVVRERLCCYGGPQGEFNIVTHTTLAQRPTVSNDIARDKRFVMQQECARFGIGSMGLFPLILNNEAQGVLALYAKDKYFFDRDEMKLLAELASDISFAMDYIEKAKKLDFLANHDQVTGLPNRALLHDRLRQALNFAYRYQLSTAVLFIDLDRFKTINDSLGHTVGDEVLKVAAKRILSTVRVTDTVARQGGDEFVVVLAGSQADDDGISIAAQRIVDAFATPIDISGREVFVSCSIGIAVYSGGGSDPDELLKSADTAMYRAKEQGGAGFRRYRVGLDKISEDRLTLETELRHAISQDQLRLYYQPRFDLQSDSLTGAEALVRWQHPQRGLLGPSEFISIAEETGVILQLGEWVLQAACEQAARWNNVHVAVNLSARQFRQPELVQTVARILRETQLDPRYLELELTESMLMQDIDAAIVTMTELKNLGVQISLDDFGTGYSSLNYLKRLPIDAVKIDQSFIRDITSDADCAAIVDAIIAMSHSLQLSVIAEGVENEDQFDELRRRGCEQLQGYMFSEPLLAPEVEHLMQHYPGLGGISRNICADSDAMSNIRPPSNAE